MRGTSNSLMSHENYVTEMPQSISYKGRVYLRISILLSLHRAGNSIQGVWGGRRGRGGARRYSIFRKTFVSRKIFRPGQITPLSQQSLFFPGIFYQVNRFPILYAISRIKEEKVSRLRKSHVLPTRVRLSACHWAKYMSRSKTDASYNSH